MGRSYDGSLLAELNTSLPLDQVQTTVLLLSLLSFVLYSGYIYLVLDKQQLVQIMKNLKNTVKLLREHIITNSIKILTFTNNSDFSLFVIQKVSVNPLKANIDFEQIMTKAEVQYQRELDGYTSVESVFKSSADRDQARVCLVSVYIV